MELSVYDLSKYLGVTTGTIERWLRQGKLPVSRKGAKIKFHIRELENWASKHNLVLKIKDSVSPPTTAKKEISLSRAVQAGGIYQNISGDSTQTVLSHAIEIVSTLPEQHKSELLERLLDRENALSTGIGNGIAIPHPREQVGFIDEPMVIVCYLKEPVDYKALDNKPVSFLFILLCPELKMHLQLLSSLSLCLKNPEFMSFIETHPPVDKLSEKIDTLLKDTQMS